MLRNGLYIVATPIGNLQDISAHAVEILNQVPIVACEDTRVTKKLFSLLGISLQKKFITCEDHNEEKHSEKIIASILEGNPVALVSDAGSPLISDPGFKLVRRCRTEGIYVTTVPGACAVVSALQLSGLPTNRFMFAGFIPNKDKARHDLFAELQSLDSTLVFYETAPRLLKTLACIGEHFSGRELAVVREISKMYEETVCGSKEEVIAHFEENEPRGEFVIIIAPPIEKTSISTDEIRRHLTALMRETSLKTAVKEICCRYKLNKNEVYAMALEIRDEQLSKG